MNSAVILGAGIAGSALAHRLATSHRIVVVDADPAKAEEVVRGVRDLGGVALARDTDVSDLAAVTDLAAHIADGDLALVAHLVGGWRGSPGLDAEALSAYAALATPLLTTVQVSSVAFREALAASGGRFAMVTSTAAPTAGNAAYTTAKAAAETWLRAMAHSLRDTSAAVCVFAVKALVSAQMRAQKPEAAFAGYTDVADLAEAIAQTMHAQPVTPGWIRTDLTGTT